MGTGIVVTNRMNALTATTTLTIPLPTAENRPALDAVSRAQAGDVDAFEAIYREHSPRVYALCLRLAGDSGADASELMQDVFIRAWRGLGSFRGDCAFSSWLHRLAVNVMLETARSDKRRTSRVLVMEDPDTVGAPSASVTPDLRMDLEDAMARLPPGARMAFVLHDIEGYKHEEIAEQLGVAVGTVKAQLHRARKLLIKALER
ncbi:MAG: sigma-70 family RNA polymerase sigma factor [Gemmatimonadaceae bacterium]